MTREEYDAVKSKVSQYDALLNRKAEIQKLLNIFQDESSDIRMFNVDYNKPGYKHEYADTARTTININKGLINKIAPGEDELFARIKETTVNYLTGLLVSIDTELENV